MSSKLIAIGAWLALTALPACVGGDPPIGRVAGQPMPDAPRSAVAQAEITDLPVGTCQTFACKLPTGELLPFGRCNL